MQPMYPGMPNSPKTTIVGAIGASETTITIDDGDKLPAAPNLAVIGTGEDCETILYAVKSGAVLSGITRGVQGTASMWPGGTVIARNFTAADYDALRENLENLTPGDIGAVPTSRKLNNMDLSEDRDLTAADIKVPKPNLLDNAWFRQNQLGQSEYTSNGYCWDRWGLYMASGTGASFTPNPSGGINAAASNTEAVLLYQKIPTFAISSAMIYTLSFVCDTGTYICTGLFSGAEELTPFGSIGMSTLEGVPQIWCSINASQSVHIPYVVLEPGDVSTAQFATPPKPGAELAECRRYQIFGSDIQGTQFLRLADDIYFFIPIPPMRIQPVLRGQWRIYESHSNTLLDGFTFSVLAQCANGLVVVAHKPAHGITDAYIVGLASVGAGIDANL